MAGTGFTLMAVSIEDLYRSYGVLADAKDTLSQVRKRLTIGLKRDPTRVC